MLTQKIIGEQYLPLVLYATGQQLGSTVNSFINQEAIKMLSDCRALHCGKHQLRAKIMLNN